MYQRTTATKPKTRVISCSHVASKDAFFNPIPTSNSAIQSMGIQQYQQTHHMTINKPYAPTYKELMQISEPRKRVSMYEKAFKQFGKADSRLSMWIKRVKAKGLPEPMKEGYQPKRRHCDLHATPSRGPNPTSSSISTSIKSILLRKASAPSMTTTTSNQRKDANVPRPSLSKLLRQTPSFNRLSMSISTKSKISPRPDDVQHHKDQNTTTTTTTTHGRHPMRAHPRNGIPSKLWQRYSIQPTPPPIDNRKSHHNKPTTCSSISSSLSSRIARTRKSIDLWMLGSEKKKETQEKLHVEDDTKKSHIRSMDAHQMTTSLRALNEKKSRNKLSTRCSIISARV